MRNNSFSIFEKQINGVFGLIGWPHGTFKIVPGIYKRDFLRGGDIELDGKPVRYLVPSEAVRDGIIYVTEDRKLEGFFETMSIAENFYSGLLASGLVKSSVINFQEMRELSAEWSERLNVKAIDEAIITAKISRLIPIIAKRASKARRSGGKAIRTTNAATAPGMRSMPSETGRSSGGGTKSGSSR